LLETTACSVGVLNKDGVVYDGAIPRGATPIDIYMGPGSQKSSFCTLYINREESAPAPPSFRRSHSYSTAVAADCITVTTNISAARVSDIMQQVLKM
jgi:hypothetical protein